MLKVVTPLRLLAGALKTDKTTGSVLTHGTTLGETKVPSKSSRVTVVLTIKFMPASPSEVLSLLYLLLKFKILSFF
jgi:hypothetical protein